ncbi:spore germination protein KB [Bacillus pakistanensis]|uniref:Spore germination protein KB n=1 Tax=Rossellomorea pakistanensis TaxID=992288 RepID=A0ABS2N707_9BACI|nr:endospore germination permease [Bacillus pakistanensis]MBM7583637.1 spore germination protein KB [Bacillus pakistanensis]
MLENAKISRRQFRCLVIFFTIGTTILVIPSGLAFHAKQDAWIAAALGVAIGLLVVILYTQLSLRFPQKTFVQMNEQLFGKWLGKGFSIIFISMSFLYTSMVLYYAGNFLKTQFYPETPVEAIHIIMALILIMGVRLGLETFTRAAEILFPTFFLLFVILVIFISPQIQFENILPIFDVKLKPLSRATLSVIVTSSFNSIVLLMIFPAFVNQPKEARKAFLIGNLIGGIVIVLITLLCILVLGAETSSRLLYPSFALARKINVGGFIQRIEAVLAMMWFFSMYFKMVLYFYASCIGIAQVLNLKGYRPLTLPLGGMIVILSFLIYPNVVYQQNWDVKTSEPFSITVGLLLPLLMLAVAMVRKRKENKKTTSN